MNLKLSFSWIGIVVFALPMIINIFYAFFPPADSPAAAAPVPKALEMVEQASRIAYLLVITFAVSKKQPTVHSAWLYLAVLFLALYYAVWFRYFLSGRKTELLGKSFLFVPIPLAVFPVAYYIFAALWLHNIPAAAVMTVFGAAHIAVSFLSFRK